MRNAGLRAAILTAAGLATVFVPASNAYIRSQFAFVDGSFAVQRRTDNAGIQFYVNDKIMANVVTPVTAVTVISATHDFKMLDVSDRIIWIRDGQIDEEASGANLRLHAVTQRRKSRGNLFFEDRIRIPTCLLRYAQSSGLCEREEHL